MLRELIQAGRLIRGEDENKAFVGEASDLKLTYRIKRKHEQHVKLNYSYNRLTKI